jgi:hypothetical protein
MQNREDIHFHQQECLIFVVWRRKKRIQVYIIRKCLVSIIIKQLVWVYQNNLN